MTPISKLSPRGVKMADLSADEIDEAIVNLVVSGPTGPEAGVTLARIAGRAIKILRDTVGHDAAVATAETLVKKLREGRLQ